MKSIKAFYDEKADNISIDGDAVEENWPDVCDKFGNDVHRIRDVGDLNDYTALYECFDDNNERHYYLVKEDSGLYRLKRRHFLENIGRKDSQDL